MFVDEEECASTDAERRQRLETPNDPAGERLGDRIARLRRAKGWNQKELAERIGSRGTQISKYERGTYVPRADILSRLGDSLGVSTDYLLSGRKSGEPRRDLRLRERLEALEALPERQRDNLVGFLDSLLAAHQLVRRTQEKRKQAGPARRTRTPVRSTRKKKPTRRKSR